MKKIEFEKNLKNRCHEYLYINNDKKDCYIKNCVGCIHKKNYYEIYQINDNKDYVFLGIFNCEDDAYAYLNEIFYILHQREINNLLSEYLRCNNEEKARYFKMINFYLMNDIEFAREYHLRKGRSHIKRKEFR